MGIAKHMFSGLAVLQSNTVPRCPSAKARPPVSHEKKLAVRLFDIEDCTTQLYREYNKPL